MTMKSEFDVRMQYHRETGNHPTVESGEGYCECGESGTIRLNEAFYEWIIEKITNPEVIVKKELSEEMIEEINDGIDSIIYDLNAMKL